MATYLHTNRLVSNVEDQLFYTITEGQETITLTQFTSVSADPLGSSLVRYCPQTQTSRPQALRKTGLLTSDPRLRDCVHAMRQSLRSSAGPVLMDKALFRRWERFYSL